MASHCKLVCMMIDGIFFNSRIKLEIFLNNDSILFHILEKRSKVRLGEHDIKNPNPDCRKYSNGKNIPIKVCNEEVQDFEVERVVFHHDYNIPTPFRNDIAMIKLKGSVTQNGECNNEKYDLKDFITQNMS